MKTLLALLCLIFVAFAAAQTDDTFPDSPASPLNLTTTTSLVGLRNGVQGYGFSIPLPGGAPVPPVQQGEEYEYYLRMVIFFENPSEKFFIDFDATSDKHIDYFVKGEHSLESTLVLMDPRTGNPGEGQNGWDATGLDCGVFTGAIFSEVPVSAVSIVFIPINGQIVPPAPGSSLCPGGDFVDDDFYYGEEEDDGVRLFLISFFSTFGILLFVFSLCLCAFACIRSCRYKCRTRRCARKAKKAAQAELKATTQLVPAVAVPATIETPAQEQAFSAPLYPFYPEQAFPQYPQYSMLATAPQQYYSDQPQVQYVAFHPMMFPGYPQQPNQQ